MCEAMYSDFRGCIHTAPSRERDHVSHLRLRCIWFRQPFHSPLPGSGDDHNPAARQHCTARHISSVRGLLRLHASITGVPGPRAVMPAFAFGVALLASLSVVQAKLVPGLRVRQSITALTSAQIAAFTPYTWYASAGYCSASETLSWSCGSNCEANPNFEPVASGGNGDTTQYWFVGYDPTLDTVVVSHQGTDPEDILPLLTDGDAVLTNLNSSLFPGVSSDIEVHQGFADSQSSTASDVLSAVQTTMSKYSTNNIAIVGHSLGAAISLLDAVYLPLYIPGATYTYIGYGLPRVGNQAFANYIDALSTSVTHINNEEDPIPICPGMSLGYVHPSGEVHIQDSGEWAACPGQDNPSTQCIVGDVPSILDGDESDHDGPYNGITMGC
ncbi:Alpha/Beta hydrolase protein [Fomitopsis serialis]|uniref:Alpha/Beta hydrolase protein n=1 Tax=Fomitopsis serialis TaxID=139415 RepID=UPI0020081AB1|nr:Alpha/Beta hydrolase protein [Neoantrodia serialis]KAH9926973.1 Alpha/Beta hydrolase protein [Neoantrodia serialis]